MKGSVANSQKKEQRLDGGPGLFAEFSKCDFWNLGDFFIEICGRFFSSNIFRSEIFSIEKRCFRKIVFRDKKNRKKFLWKSQWKMKILKFYFFRFFPEFWNFILSLTFSYNNFDFFFRPKNLTFFFDDLFSFENYFQKKISITYFDPKWSQDSENHT